MKSIMKVAVVVAFVSGSAAGQDRPKLAPGVPEFVPDPTWEATAGRTGSVRRNSAAGTTLVNYRRYRVAADAADSVGVEALMKSGAIVSLEAGDAVQVLRDNAPVEAPRMRSTGSYLDSIATAGQRPPPPDMGIDVRVLSGLHAGKNLVVAKDSVAGMIPNPRPWLNIRPGKAVALVDPEIPIAADIETYRSLRINPYDAEDMIAKGKAFRPSEGDVLTVNEVVVDRKKKVETDAAKVRVKGKATRYGVVYRGNLMPAAK